MIEMGDDSEQFDLSEVEERFNIQSQSQGFVEGLEQGKKAGLEEGFSCGSDEGSKIGSEIGYYRGHLMVWLQMQQLEPENSSKSTKLINKLGETLDLIGNFPTTNQEICELRLSEIRSKVKQVTSMLGVTLCDISSQ